MLSSRGTGTQRQGVNALSRISRSSCCCSHTSSDCCTADVTAPSSGRSGAERETGLHDRCSDERVLVAGMSRTHRGGQRGGGHEPGLQQCVLQPGRRRRLLPRAQRRGRNARCQAAAQHRLPVTLVPAAGPEMESDRASKCECQCRWYKCKWGRCSAWLWLMCVNVCHAAHVQSALL